jgi:hypothetical protein
MTNELPKIMADIAAEIEAKKAYQQGAPNGPGDAQGGKERPGNLQMGQGGVRGRAKAPLVFSARLPRP